ncbi:MAG: hypothetical protein ACE5R6_08575 [Candidatus Heimdallarchaeota archaeon]
MNQKENKQEEESIGWSPKQYLAFIIALFQTVLLPILLLIVLFFVLAVLVGYI